MTTPSLLPDLRLIESGLLVTAAELATEVKDAIPNASDDDVGDAADRITTLINPTSTTDSPQARLPDHLQRLIHQRVAAKATHSADMAPAPVPGELRWIATPTGWPVALLVDTLDGEHVKGWLVSSETLYASHQDWLLQDSDVQTPLDPRATLVQLWNPLVLAQAQLGDCLGSLTAKALQDMQATQHSLFTTPTPDSPLDTAPSPGRFGVRQLNKVSFVCGTTLAAKPSQDPRHHYRYLYTLFSQQLQRQAPPSTLDALAPSLAKFPGKGRAPAANQPWWRNAGWAAAALLALVIPWQAWQWMPGTQSDRDSATETRGIGTPAPIFGWSARFKVIEVNFAPEAQLSAITALLDSLEASLVAGPTDTGSYWVAVDRIQQDSALQALQKSLLVVCAVVAVP